jgi:transcription initiation factor TFIIIB Brf1 subunit/transcription initiation factor TFIIB
MGSVSVLDRPSPIPFGQDLQDDERQCRSCHSLGLRTDWAQGDRICTNCGVVDEGHMLDDRPEWRDFHDDNDIVKRGNATAGARSGLVIVDESKWIGGMQPTMLGPIFGSSSTGQSTRKRLVSLNRKIDRSMEKMHSRAVETAKLSSQIRKKRKLNQEEEDHVRPEFEQMVLQEEEDADRVKAALYAEKWSLDRAILLFGSTKRTQY